MSDPQEEQKQRRRRRRANSENRKRWQSEPPPPRFRGNNNNLIREESVISDLAGGEGEIRGREEPREVIRTEEYPGQGSRSRFIFNQPVVDFQGYAEYNSWQRNNFDPFYAVRGFSARGNGRQVAYFDCVTRVPLNVQLTPSGASKFYCN